MDSLHSRHPQRGLTLIESAVTVAVAAILLCAAAPDLAGLLERDRRVLTAARSAGLPVGIVCGGGYCVDIAAIVEIHAGTMLLAADLLAAEGK